MSRLLAQSALRAAVRDAVARQPGFTSHRSFSSLPALRPGTSAAAPGTIFSRRPTTTTLLQGAFTPSAPGGAAPGAAAAAAAADVVPTSAISALLQGQQIRCGPRRYMNMNRPSRLIRQRRHGFLSRIRTKSGRKTLQRRLSKGRKMLSA